jgi:hypothetical protein
MSVWTRQELVELIGVYKSALRRVAAGQTVEIEGESYTLASIRALRSMLDYAEDELNKLDGKPGGLTIVAGRPVR